MKFSIKKTERIGVRSDRGAAGALLHLRASKWDDYSFKTTFKALLLDESGNTHDLGEVKIGTVGQGTGWTEALLPAEADELPMGFFSLGQSVDYYRLLSQLPEALRVRYLAAMRDLVSNRELLEVVKTEEVFKHSLLRGVNLSSITQQYSRVLEGGAVLTEYRFRYELERSEKQAGFVLDFEVSPDLKPSRNIHVLIGRNGVGKTSLLNGMISALASEDEGELRGQFFDTSRSKARRVEAGFFSSLISVSFSAFDPFLPPPDKDSEHGLVGYCYIGLKDLEGAQSRRTSGAHKSIDQLPEEFVSSLMGCLGLEHKRRRWSAAISLLESDPNFEEINLSRLLEPETQEVLRRRAANVFIKMSSGHKIVLLTITRLIERAEEKTLVVMDEPECHLHPPLLSAFIRAVSDLLTAINGVAIVATHSPVVLQEVPRSCVWKLYRTRLSSSQERPEVETFGENVGTLTRDVFRLEVERSGFYAELQSTVRQGGSYDEILKKFQGQIGFEGKAILRALVQAREESQE